MAPTLVDVIDLHEDKWRHRTLNWFCTNDARLKQFCRTHKIGVDEKIVVIGRTGRVRELINRGNLIEVVLISFRPTLSWQIMVMAHHEIGSKEEAHYEQFKSMREGLEERRRRWAERKRKIAANLRRRGR